MYSPKTASNDNIQHLLSPSLNTQLLQDKQFESEIRTRQKERRSKSQKSSRKKVELNTIQKLVWKHEPWKITSFSKCFSQQL